MIKSVPPAPPPNRRERPAKPALTRDGIVAAALLVLRAEGLGKVTMRRVAQQLDTGHASLYVYVRDTADLHAQVLDALLAPALAVAGPGRAGAAASRPCSPGTWTCSPPTPRSPGWRSPPGPAARTTRSCSTGCSGC